MNREKIIELAREARFVEPTHPFNPWSVSGDDLERFAALVEREVRGGSMSSEQEAILRFGIEIEKMLCEKLGKQWRPSGMSIESLVEEMSAMVKPNDVPPIPEGHPHVHPVTPAPVYENPMTQPNIYLRDHFAGLAMQALLTVLETGKEHQAALIPRTAYDMADQMLKAREAK